PGVAKIQLVLLNSQPCRRVTQIADCEQAQALSSPHVRGRLPFETHAEGSSELRDRCFFLSPPVAPPAATSAWDAAPAQRPRIWRTKLCTRSARASHVYGRTSAYAWAASCSARTSSFSTRRIARARA